MLTAAVGAGIGAVTDGALLYFKVDQFGYQLVARTVMGGIAGGVVSSIYGGNFWQGFAMGAGTAASAFLFNCATTEVKKTVVVTLYKHNFLGEWVPDKTITLSAKDAQKWRNALDPYPEWRAAEWIGKEAVRQFFGELDKIFENPIAQMVGQNAPGQNPL